MELGDFKEKKATLEDFTKGDAETRGSLLGGKAVSSVAASVALTNDQPSLDFFRKLKDDLTSYEGRDTFLRQQGLSTNQQVQELMHLMPDILLNEDMSDEDKIMSLQVVNGEAELKPTGSLEQMATQTLLNDSGPNETEEVYQSRSLLADSLDRVIETKRQQQALVNAFRERRVNEKGENLLIKDLGELMVPLTEWFATTRAVQEMSEDTPIFMGEQKEELKDLFMNAPLEQKIELTEKLIQYLENNDEVLFPDGNDLMTFHLLEQIALDGDYSDGEKWFDNIISGLDLIGVGSLVGALTGKVIKTGKAAKISSRTEVQPAAPSQVVKETNPELSRAMSIAVDEDATGEAAEALYGSSRQEALAKDHLPEPEINVDRVEIKTQQSVPQFPESEAVRVVRTRDGESYLTEAEVLRSQERVIQRADNVEGFRHNPEEMVIRTGDDGSTTFRMTFHPTDAGWKTAARAIENATYALRDFGVTPDKLNIMERGIDGSWRKTDPEKLKAKATLRSEFQRKKKAIPPNLKEMDYAVSVDYTHRFDPSDFEGFFDKMPVSRLNFLDRFVGPGIFKGSRGSLTQHLIPPRDLLDSAHVVGPAAAAVDRGVRLKKLFVEEFEEFAKSYSKLPKQDRARMRDYINDANLDGIRFSEADLMSRGFGSRDIELLKQWRRANDTLYHAANSDAAKSLRIKGRKVLTDGFENTLIVKPLKQGSIGKNTKWYDPTDGTIKSWEEANFGKTLDEFYEEGGEIVQLESAIEVDGQWIDMAISHNTPDKGYIRAIRDDEIVLSYRDGYYPVMYDANFIIKKRMKDANGKEFDKAVGTSKTRFDAEHAALRLNEDEGQEAFFVDVDRRSKVEKANGFISGEAYEAATSAGLSFQKARGQRLFDAGNNIHKAGHTNLLDPLEAVANQIHALSDKISLRNYLETTKARIIDNYKDVVEFPKDRSGKPLYPTSASELKKSPKGTDKDVADARSMYNYVYQLENGFINQIIDKGFKAVVNKIADEVGKASKGGEVWLRNFADQKPSSGIKGTAFKLFLAANPARQIVVQSAQFNQLTAVYPDYILKGTLMKDLHRVNMARMGLSKDKEALEMLAQIEKAGFTVAVDANNLVRTESLRLADVKGVDKAKSVMNAPFKALQKVGFDKGEQFVLVTSWLAHRAKAIKDGKKLNQRTYDQIAGEARGYTWDMNKAGDMPYTGNELNTIFQFLQVPHKASLQPLTNKQLTGRQRLQLLGYNTAMYGIPSVVVPASVIAWYTDMFGEDSEQLQILNDGLIDYMLNGIATFATGEKQAVDFGDLKPTDIMGTASMATALLTTDLSTLVAESPSGSLIFGANPRITNFAKTVSKWVVPAWDYDNPENQINYKDVVKEGAKLASGFSNGLKAVYAYKTKQKISSLGNITDDEVTDFEAFMQFFGFRTKTEEGIRQAKELIYEGQSFNSEDVRQWYNELKRVLTNKGMTPQERDFHQRVMSEVWAAFEPWETKAQETLLNAIENDMTRGVYDFAYNLVRNAGGQSTDDVRKIILQLPVSDTRTKLLEDLDLIDESIERYKN